jgi:hypothetical protein
MTVPADVLFAAPRLGPGLDASVGVLGGQAELGERPRHLAQVLQSGDAQAHDPSPGRIASTREWRVLRWLPQLPHAAELRALAEEENEAYWAAAREAAARASVALAGARRRAHDAAELSQILRSQEESG